MILWPDAERVGDVLEREVDGRRLVGHERFRFLEAVAKLAAHHVAPHELLVPAEFHRRRVRNRSLAKSSG